MPLESVPTTLHENRDRRCFVANQRPKRPYDRVPNLREPVVHDVTADISQSELAALGAHRQARMVDPK